MLKSLIGAVCAVCVSGAALAQETVTWKEDVQGWSVAIDRTIGDSCFIISGFENELFLRFQFNAPLQNVQLIVASMRWDSVRTGQDYDLEVAFGDLDAWTGTATGHRWNDILPSLVLSVPIAGQQASHFLQDFIDTETVRISYDGTEIAHLALFGADEAISSMLECQANMAKAKDMRDSSRDPFEPKPEPI